VLSGADAGGAACDGAGVGVAGAGVGDERLSSSCCESSAGTGVEDGVGSGVDPALSDGPVVDAALCSGNDSVEDASADTPVPQDFIKSAINMTMATNTAMPTTSAVFFLFSMLPPPANRLNGLVVAL
jgi:hypothetical protein